VGDAAVVKTPWWFFDEKASYERAKKNEAKRDRRADDVLTAAIAQVRSRMDGVDAFDVGAFEDGSPFRLTPKVVGMPSLVAGASGKGKSRLLHVLINGWKKARDHRRLQLVDPKGETFLLEAMSLAAEYLGLPDDQRATFVDRVHVIDVTESAVTPLNLFDRHGGRLETTFLANMRAAATRQASPHDFSDLMEFAVSILYAVVIELGFPLTYRFVERLFTDDKFRTRVLLPRIAEPMLRATIENFETVIPTQTRLAVLRQYAKLLSTRAVRVALGLSPSMVRSAAPPKDATIVLANCAVSQHAPLTVAREQAVQRILDILLEATVRPEKLRELLVIEELPVLLREKSSLGEFILEASRTLRWKGLSLLAVAQDPANALPAEMLRTLLLNLRWMASFECTKEEAAWFYPHLPVTAADAKLPEHERRARFFKAAMTLPRQHFLFHFKGEPAVQLKTIDVPEPSVLVPGCTDDMLLDVFRREIASPSMVPIDRAEAMLAAWEAEVLDRGEIAPTATTSTATTPPAPRGRSVADLLDYLQKRTPEEQE
jgi:hypothetical protein